MGVSEVASCCFKLLTSLRDCRRRTADVTVANNFSFSQGLGMKSIAPARIALTAFSVSE